jgi:hypothetical protein
MLANESRCLSFAFLKIYTFQKITKKNQHAYSRLVSIHKRTLKREFMVHNNFSHVASFEKLLGICNNIGARYNPGNASITPAALGALLEQAQQKSKVVTDAQSAYTLAVNTRKEMFDNLPTFITQLVRSAIAHRTSAETTRDLQLLKKKFYQVKEKKKAIASETQPRSSDAHPRSGYIKTFDAKLTHFASIVSIIESIPDYKPNEPEMAIEGLKAKLSELKAIMAAVSKAANDFTTARINRDEAYYGAHGISFTSRMVKEYVRSITGVRSQTSMALGKIVFKTKHL